MTPADEYEREPDGDDALAAEYVLGVLQAVERQEAARRIDSDTEFRRLVTQWEERLAPLSASYAERNPPASVKQALDRRLFADEPRDRPALSRLWRSLALWRGLAAAATVALALFIAVSVLRPPVETQPVRFVASLAAPGSDVRYLAVYDVAHNRVGLSHVSGPRASNRDFELWIIKPGSAPVSLGIIPVGATVHLPSEKAGGLPDQGAALAISLEPAGGSPTGQPTGPVVAAGDLRKI
ncbi:MAG: anti-sigma factor [Alphaproteobacteria bacterium]|jgi:anti-sigma-K factor RskA|nr:anti-sigma factor [Alphaproteobacteria bacterium]